MGQQLLSILEKWCVCSFVNKYGNILPRLGRGSTIFTKSSSKNEISFSWLEHLHSPWEVVEVTQYYTICFACNLPYFLLHSRSECWSGDNRNKRQLPVICCNQSYPCLTKGCFFELGRLIYWFMKLIARILITPWMRKTPNYTWTLPYLSKVLHLNSCIIWNCRWDWQCYADNPNACLRDYVSAASHSSWNG